MLKFQAKFCGILIALYQGDLIEESVDSVNASLPDSDSSSFFAIHEILDHAAELGDALVEFSEEHYADLMLDIVVLWIAGNQKTSVQEIRFTLSDDLKVEIFLKELESRCFEPWPPPISYAAEKAQYLARLKARGYLEA